jgi:hypothetical protein
MGDEMITDENETGYASFDDLLEATNAAADTRDVTLPSGRRVKVRGLSRYEIHVGGKMEDAFELECFNLSTCLVSPKISRGQAAAWIRKATAGGDIAELTKVIRDLSNFGKAAEKSDVPEVRDAS